MTLQRYTGLRQKTPLKAKTGLQRGGQLARTARLRPVSARKTAQTPRVKGSGCKPFPAPVAALLDARDTCQPDEVRCCQRCGYTQNLHRHHRRGKDMGGSEARSHTQCCCNALLLCLWCHFWAHTEERGQAGAEGFIVSQSVDEPGSVGVMRFAAADGGATQWPSCDGRWLCTAPEMGEQAA